MYHIKSSIVTAEGKSIEYFGISDGNKIICLLGEDKKEAADLVAVCNKYDVEENQIADIIEDFYYSNITQKQKKLSDLTDEIP